jgi:putative addiction module component (TIGR02574 family)
MELVLPLKEMTVAEKLQLMEVLWDDLSHNAEDIPTPAWHGEVLADRQREIDEGKGKFLPLDEFRQDLDREIRREVR